MAAGGGGEVGAARDSLPASPSVRSDAKRMMGDMLSLSLSLSSATLNGPGGTILGGLYVKALARSYVAEKPIWEWPYAEITAYVIL